jgi:tetratricopeptide (TPR) repeat protein
MQSNVSPIAPGGLTFMRTTISLLALPLWMLAAATQARGQETIKGLGTIAFPTSAHSSAAQTDFVRGVLLLHLFEYDEAAAAFHAAERLEPEFAMAYWGEAMTYTHPVWGEHDTTAARAALAKLASSASAREARATTARERGFLRAADVLYGDGSTARRDTLYSREMADLRRAYPHDDEVALFYALSLLGLSEGVRDVPAYLRAGAIAESVFVGNPRHPGAAHYWIHSMDDPDHAAGALVPARALARIAPDADHAQHMTSHIFMALGMWDDVVGANENAMRMVDAVRASRGRPAHYCGHYNAWLEYGYLQQGRVAMARRLMEHCRDEAMLAQRSRRSDLDPDDTPLGSFAGMWTRYVLDTRDWTGDVAGWILDSAAGPATRLDYDFTRAFVAAQRHDLPATDAAVGAYDRDARVLAAADSGHLDPETLEFGRRTGVLRLELQAMVASVRGMPDSALVIFARATASEDSLAYAFGPPFVDAPSHELLGETLLGLHRYRDAVREYTVALQRTPRRTATLLGLARAQAGAGDTSSAARTRATLAAIWHDADPGLTSTAGIRALSR